MNKTLVIASSTLAVAVIFSLSVWLAGWREDVSVENLTIAEASQAVFALVYIADEKGFFTDEGQKVTFNTFTSGKDALNSVVQGNSDIGTVFETPIVLQSYQGEELRIVSTLHNSSQNTGFVGLKSQNIESPTDLMGKTIAVTKGTNGKFFLFQFLTTQGIDLSGVDLVDVKPLVKVSTNTKLPQTGYHFENLLWWANLDSNQGPQSYQDCALTN